MSYENDQIDKLKAQYPEATKEELAQASKPRGKAMYFTRTGKGLERIDKPAADSFFKQPIEGRNKQIMPTKKKSKLKPQLWEQKVMLQFLQAQQIHAEKDERGWFVTMNKPSRKLTAKDQLEIFLAPLYRKYTVYIDRNLKHLIIDNLEGE